jgi:hypothetical protein
MQRVLRDRPGVEWFENQDIAVGGVDESDDEIFTINGRRNARQTTMFRPTAGQI